MSTNMPIMQNFQLDKTDDTDAEMHSMQEGAAQSADQERVPGGISKTRQGIKVNAWLMGITESQNPWERLHWSARQKDKESWFWVVKAALGVKQPEKARRHVHIIRVGKRMIDDQNVPAGCKYIVDALQEFGHIWRDSRRWARVTFDQRKCRSDEDPHMEITISEWEGGD